MSENREETVRHFCDVTGADETRSKFFLESSNWRLEEAISSFFEHGGNVEEPPSAAAALPSVPTLSDSDMESPPDSPPKNRKGKKKPASNFATLDSLHQNESSSDEEEDAYQLKFFLNIASKFGWLAVRFQTIVQEFFCDQASCSKKKCFADDATSNQSMDDEVNRLKAEIERLLAENSVLRKEIARLKGSETEASGSGQAFYAGGSERSGQQIIGPGKGRKDIVTEVFKSVKERGAVVFEDEPASSSRGRGGIFGGTGYRLGQTADDQDNVTQNVAATQAQNEPRSVRLRLYREGFSVDNGELRSYTDPDHSEFLNYIRRGEIPPELAGTGEVKVSLEDRRHEEGPRNQSKPSPFTGKGQMLGSPTPPTAGAGAPLATGAEDRAASRRAAQHAVRLDESQPTTTIQFRLADGSRITGRFNHSHTVEDLRQYVARAVPAYQTTTFALLTSFPSRELEESTATVASANILNSTLLQRLK